MEIEPRHVFFFLFLSCTLMLMGGIADGVLAPGAGNESALDTLAHGGFVDKLSAFFKMFNMNYDWLNEWIAWPFRIVNWAFALLIARQLWKLVPVVGR